MLAISVFAGVKITDTSTGRTASGATVWDAVSAFLSGGSNRVTGRAVGGQLPPGCVFADVFTWSGFSPVSEIVDSPLSGVATGVYPTADIKIGATTGQIDCTREGPGVEFHNQDGFLIATAPCNSVGSQPIEVLDINSAQIRPGDVLSVIATDTRGEQIVTLTAGSFELIQCNMCAGDKKDCATDADCDPGNTCWGGTVTTSICTGFCTDGLATMSDDGLDCSQCQTWDLTTLTDGTFVGPRKFGPHMVTTEIVTYGSVFQNKDFKSLFKQMAALVKSNSPFEQLSGPVLATDNGKETVVTTWLQSTTEPASESGQTDSGLGQELLIPDEPDDEEKVCLEYKYCGNGKSSAKLCSTTPCKTEADCFNKGVDPNIKVPKAYVSFQDRDKNGNKQGRVVSVGTVKCGAAVDCTPKTNGVVDCNSSK